MNVINLSYVLTTYNKIDYLKNVLYETVSNLKQDEEIIVVDGGSRDGTTEYLKELFAAGKIHKYISEKDFGEGHGFNKGILMAEGKLIKLLTDDDAFYFPGIQVCKRYMLENPQIDFLNTNGGWYDIQSDSKIFVFTKIYFTMFNKWKKTDMPFAFCMLGCMINAKSIPYLGLLNPVVKRADAEYSLRITAQKLNMTWYTGSTYVRILNAKSNSDIYFSKIKEETKRLNSYYNVSIDFDDNDSLINPSILLKFRIYLKKIFNLRSLTTDNLSNKGNDLQPDITKKHIGIDNAFYKAKLWMKDQFTCLDGVFYTNQNDA